MGALLSYSIISGLLMLAMYLAYRIFMARDNQHSFNRGVLLAIYSISFLALPIFKSIEQLVNTQAAHTISLNGVEILSAAVKESTTPLWGTILIWIFIAGMSIVAIKSVITWVRLTNVIRSGKRIKQNGYTLVVTDNEKFAPFSWMHYVVITHSDYDNNFSAIATHELKHVASRHWIDLFIAQIVCVINWFNPAAWLMRDELMLVHEYQADMAVIDNGHNQQEYQLLLIKKAVGSRFPSLANSLNHSKLKKRITMMYKEKSGAGHRLKALALVPMFALALGVATVPSVRAAVSTISNSEVTVNKGSEKRPTDKTDVKVFKVTSINNNGNETTVTIKGKGLGNNLTISGGTFTTMNKTYQAKALQCNMSDGAATITATFPFTSEYENTSMTLTVNGEVIPFELDNFMNSAQTIVIEDNQQTNASSSNPVSLPNGMKIYLDGEEINPLNLQNVDSEKIAAITIDKKNNAIKITLKQ